MSRTTRWRRLYHVVSQQGLPEANPLVRNTIYEWGVVWGIVYWKLFACALLGLIFALRHRKYTLTFQALAVTSAVYGSFSSWRCFSS